MIRRKQWLAIHRWLALVLGLHWLLLAATGCLLVFHREIETSWIGAGAPVTGMPNVDAAIATVEGQTDSSVKLVVIEDRPVRALRVFAGDRIHTLDAASAKLLSSSGIDGASTPSGIVRFVYALHYQLSGGAVGEWLVGASGAFLLITVIVGLKLGWPAKGMWWRTIRPRLAGKAWHRHYAIHRSVGLLVSLALISASVTGMTMIWGDAIRGMFTSAMPDPAVSPGSGSPGQPPSPNEAIAAAMAEVPGSDFVRIDLPTAKRDSYLVRVREPGEFRPVFGTSIIEIAANDGRVLDARLASSAPGGKRAVDAMFPLHNGAWLGIWGRILVLMQGAGLIYLTVSGFIVWLARRKRS